MDTLAIALSGLQGASTRLAVSAHNVANLSSEDFRPLRAEAEAEAGGGTRTRIRSASSPEPVGLVREIVEQDRASLQYSASARVFRVEAELRGRLLDVLA